MHACDVSVCTHGTQEFAGLVQLSIPCNHSDKKAYLSSKSDDRVTFCSEAG